MRPFLLLYVAVLATPPAFSQAVHSTVYPWNHAPVANPMGYEERTLLEGSSRDFSHLTLQAIRLPARQPDQPTQQLDEEALLVVKTGELTLTLGGKRQRLGPGSVALIMPGDDYRLTNQAAQPLTYYWLRYTSNEVPDLDLYRLAGGSFAIDGQTLPVTSDGPTRRLFACASVMSPRLEMQLTTLGPGSESPPAQTQRAAEILIVLDRPVDVCMDGVLKRAQAGDVIFAESEVAHQVEPVGQEGSTYLTIRF